MSNEFKDYEWEKRQHIFSQISNLPDGWYKSVVPNLVNDLINVLGPYVFDFEVLQSKEKYGSLRLYWAWRDGSFRDPEVDWNKMRNDIESVIHKYERISYKTCADCGAAAVYDNDGYGYMIPLCEKCFNK